MATPRKTAKAAEQLRVSQIGDFKQRMGGIQQLPSGLVVKVRNPGGLTAFVASGKIPNSLLKVVQDSLGDAKQSKEELVAKAQNLSEDMDSIREMMELMNIITAEVVVEPDVRLAPTEDDVTKWNILHPDEQVSTPEQLRDDENILYIDEIEELDKQFLFQWVTGGTRDLEKFRKQHERNMDVVSAGSGPKASAKSDAGADAG